MEIPEISIIGDFEAGMKCLRQNSSLISRFFSLSGLETVHQLHSFWKWGAVILALIATFSGIINRIKLFITWVRTIKPLDSSSKPLLQLFDDDEELSEDETSSSASLEDEEYESTSSFDDQIPVDEDFRVAGSSFYSENQSRNGKFKLRKRRSCGDGFSWSDFGAGTSVVKLWDSLGLGLEFEDFADGVVSIWDLNKDQKKSSFLAGNGSRQIPAVAMSSPAVALSAGLDKSNAVVLGAHDMRVARQTPAICAEWKTPAGKAVEDLNSGGVEKVFVRDDVSGFITVVDMRNVKMPLDNVTESDGETWMDADAVTSEGVGVR
ncbi:unnamed protein product [Ilex paraguariensis]|uniref:Uncharacterized protein n=1 Tax=Ilex paraguariensis TaxID=185542 RepID=A0ABC8TP61_9AQUA